MTVSARYEPAQSGTRLPTQVRAALEIRLQRLENLGPRCGSKPSCVRKIASAIPAPAHPTVNDPPCALPAPRCRTDSEHLLIVRVHPRHRRSRERPHDLQFRLRSGFRSAASCFIHSGAHRILKCERLLARGNRKSVRLVQPLGFRLTMFTSCLFVSSSGTPAAPAPLPLRHRRQRLRFRAQSPPKPSTPPSVPSCYFRPASAIPSDPEN